MTLYDTWKKTSDGSFQSAVHLIVMHCPTAVTSNQLARLLKTAARGGWVGEYEWGKVEAALRSTPAGQTPPPAPPLNGRGDVEYTVEDSTRPSPLGEGPGVGLNRRLHKRHSHHHAFLISATTDAERAEHARTIMLDIIPALDAEYDRLRSTPPPSPLGEGKGVGLNAPGVEEIRRLQTLRVRLSNLKKLIPAAPTIERRQQLETEQAEKQAEAARLEALLA